MLNYLSAPVCMQQQKDGLRKSVNFLVVSIRNLSEYKKKPVTACCLLFAVATKSFWLLTGPQVRRISVTVFTYRASVGLDASSDTIGGYGDVPWRAERNHARLHQKTQTGRQDQ